MPLFPDDGGIFVSFIFAHKGKKVVFHEQDSSAVVGHSTNMWAWNHKSLS